MSENIASTVDGTNAVVEPSEEAQSVAEADIIDIVTEIKNGTRKGRKRGPAEPVIEEPDPDYDPSKIKHTSRPWQTHEVGLVGRMDRRLPKVAGEAFCTGLNRVDDSYQESCRLIADKFTHASGQPIIIRWQGQWYVWSEGAWEHIKDCDIEQWITHTYAHAHYHKIATNEDGEKHWVPVDWEQTSGIVKEIYKQLSNVAGGASTLTGGVWLDGREDKELYIPCRNGLLRVSDRQLLPHDPAYFSLYSLPLDYDPKATCPKWESFMTNTYAHDPDTIPMKQEWFGYVLSGRTDLQKGMFTYGPKRTGKGTEARILQNLMGGPAKCSGITLADFGQNFGMSGLVGKALAVIGDARIDKRGGENVVIQRMLSIIGEDTIQVDRKHIDPFQGKLPTRFMILSNEILNWGDSGDALPSRFLVASTVESFYGKEDPDLEPTLMAELAGILNWALDGLDRLNKTRRFTINKTTVDVLGVQTERSAPLKTFGEEMCILGEDKWVLKSNFLAAWASWCIANGRPVPTDTQASLSQKIKSYFPTVEVTNKKRRVEGSLKPVYVGIGLKADYPDTQLTIDEGGQALSDI